MKCPICRTEVETEKQAEHQKCLDQFFGSNCEESKQAALNDYRNGNCKTTDELIKEIMNR